MTPTTGGDAPTAPPTIMGEWELGLLWLVLALGAALALRPVARRVAAPRMRGIAAAPTTEPRPQPPRRAALRPGRFAPPRTGPPEPDGARSRVFAS